MQFSQPLPFIDFTSRDFEAIKASLVDYLKQRFPDDFTDFSESQLGIAMLEIVSYSYAILSYMLDRQVNEVYIETARERQSVIRLAALLGYKLAGASASSVILLLDTTALSTYAGPVVFAKGAQASAGEQIFELDKAYTIQRQGTSPNYTYPVNGLQYGISPFVTAVHGETVVDTFTANGAKFMELTLSRAPLIDGSLATTVAGVPWTLVDSLVLGDSALPTNSKIYEILLDKDDRPTARFGDGVAGDVPVSGSQVVLTYRVGGGAVGNVAAGVINQALAAVHNGTDSISIGAANQGKATGGADRETVDHARVFAPQWARTTDRAVTYLDYFTLCNGYTDTANGTIAKAGIIADPTDGISNTVTVYTWAYDSSGALGKAGTSLKDSLRNFLETRRTLAVWIAPIQDGVNIPIDVDVLVRLDQGFDKTLTTAAIASAISSLFQESRVLYGNELRTSWIYSAVQSVLGINWVHVRKPDPTVVEDLTTDIEKGVLPDLTGIQVDEVILSPGVARQADYYVNYRVQVGSQVLRVIDSGVSYGAGLVLAKVEAVWSPPISQGQVYFITHPRRVRFVTGKVSTVDDYYNSRVLLVDDSSSPGNSQDRAIIDYDGANQIAVVDKDWTTTPTAGLKFKITPDYRVIDSQALVQGVVTIEVVT